MVESNNNWINQGNTQVEEEEDGLQLKDIISIIVIRKWWIVGSVIACLVLACMYLQKTSKVYSRYTTIMIKDETKGGSMGGLANELSGLGMLDTKSSVDNEIEAFKSPYLMYMVVKKLKLDIEYKERHLLNKKDLYGKSPIEAKFMNPNESDEFSFKVDIEQNGMLKLRDFVMIDTIANEVVKDDTTEIQVHPFQSVSTPVGIVTICLSDNYDQEKDVDRTIIVGKKNANKIADENCKELTVELASKKASVLTLTYNSTSQKKSEDVLNSLLEIYNQDRIDEKRESAILTSKFIDGRLMIIEQELGGIDNDIEQYKSHQLLTNVQIEGAKYVNESAEYSEKVLQMSNQVSIANFMKEKLSESTDKPELLPTNSGLTDPGISTLIKEYNDMVLKRDKLVANSSIKNPLVVELTKSLEGMKESVNKSLENIIETNTMMLNSLKQKEGQISSKIAHNPKQEKYLQSIGRQQKIKESLYLYLLQKREENELSGNIQVSNVRIITPPRGDEKPIKPKKLQILALALILGMGLPIGIFWLMDTLNTTVRGKKDIEGLSIPFLGDVPMCGKINDKVKGPMDIAVVVKDKSRDFANEAFRVLRTNFTFMTNNNTKVIMYTSFYANSGKTFVATNMGLSLALTGKRVLLIDLDLRKGEMSNALAKKRTGASTYLSGQTDKVEDCIVNTKLNKNLDILPCGVIPPNPAELLLSNRLEKMIEKLKTEYDFIFVDGTPMQIVADAQIVGKIAELVLFVIREGKFERSLLPDVEKVYKDGTFKRMATILNCSGATLSYGKYGNYGGYGGYGKYGNYGGYGNYGTYGHEDQVVDLGEVDDKEQ